ncbi:hypothetical protein HUJ05_009084 [Dendroctonus ponderosae]|nr:hypothetical protein HUJ05_010891 [Dendroctonus ponderosae]KAH1008534.1 hypothetical protein HUJ05_009080 [Dendroctonus ponderosae]KAH1008538.1 hypothetical protein HUJ05_009084 [Dendroctonus ponderosae]
MGANIDAVLWGLPPPWETASPVVCLTTATISTRSRSRGAIYPPWLMRWMTLLRPTNGVLSPGCSTGGKTEKRRPQLVWSRC